MAAQKSLLANAKRASGSGGMADVHGAAESRDSYKSPPAVKAAPKQLHFKDILREVETGYADLEEVKAGKKKKPEKEKEKKDREEDAKERDGKYRIQSVLEYDPEQPLLLSHPNLMAKVTAKTTRQAERDSTRPLEQNVHLVGHMIAGAPYTRSMCKKCTRDRNCRAHREIRQERASISLCKHTWMHLYWAVDDPTNEKCSWKVEIKDYYLDDEKEGKKHRQCAAYRPSERVKELAKRLVEDLRNERITKASANSRETLKVRGVTALRGSTRRAELEIYALVGAWEDAKRLKAAVELKRREAACKAQEAQEALVETLRKMIEIKKKDIEREDKKKKEEEETDSTRTMLAVEEAKTEVKKPRRGEKLEIGVVERKVQQKKRNISGLEYSEIVTISKRARRELIEAVRTSSPTAAQDDEPLPKSPSSPKRSGVPLTFSTQSQFTSKSASRKRKQSPESALDCGASSSSKKAKKVSFAHTVETALLMDSPHLLSLPSETGSENKIVAKKTIDEEAVIAWSTPVATKPIHDNEGEVEYYHDDLEWEM